MAARPILIITVAMGAVATANASPRSDPTTGRAVFTGAAAPSATSVSLNPAALGLGKRSEIYFALAGFLDQLGIDRRAIDLETNTLVPAERVSDHPIGIGGQIAGVWQVATTGKVGVELRLPPPELFPSNPALRYHTLGTQQRNFVGTIGASLRISSRFYLGFSVANDVTKLRLRYSRDTALDDGLAADCGGMPCGLENPDAAETYDVDVRSKWLSAENLKLNLGIVLRVWRNIWLGLAYHNTPGFGIQTDLAGTMTVSRAPRDGGAKLVGDSTVFVSYPASVDGEVRAGLLPELDLHVGGRWEDLSRMQSYDVRGYGDAFRGQSIPEWVLRPRGFHDSFALWAGVEQVETDQRQKFRFGGRLGIETSALQPDRTAPGTVSPTSFTIDLGAQARVSRQWRIQLSYGFQFFPSVDVTSSDYDPRFAIACAESGFDYATRDCAALRNGYAIPTAAGEYSRFQHAFRLGFVYERP